MAAGGHQQPGQAPETVQRVLYVGTRPASVAALLQPDPQLISYQAESRVAAALMAVASRSFDTVIIDQREIDDSLTLMIAALAASRNPPKVIVLAQPADVGQFLRYPGVRSVLSYPLKPRQLKAAVERREPPVPPQLEAVPPPAPAPEEPVMLAHPERKAKLDASPGLRQLLMVQGRFMSAISALYKNAAFVLLATLFSAFTFYGVLIGYFLVSSGWGAPMTLSRGHELVEKSIRDAGELRVSLSVNSQRLSEAELEGGKAMQARDDATVLVDFMRGTIGSEIESRQAQSKLAQSAVNRLQTIIEEFGPAQKAGKKLTSPDVLYKKRLITKRSYDALKAGSQEASQRLAVLENEVERMTAEIATHASTIAFLSSLAARMATGDASSAMAPGSADMILLTKEAVDARSRLDMALNQLNSAQNRQDLLRKNADFIEMRIAEIENGPLGRAAQSRVDVIFVPYGNEKHFTTGSPLYTCMLTVLFCHRAGTVGAIAPGESTTVHPFFGKPIRGFFVEAHLDDPDAASEEIIHAGRAPFFF